MSKLRMNLKLFRIRRNFSQAAFADKIGCNRGTYLAIENGTRNGRASFWRKLKEAFPEANIEELKKLDENQ